MIFVSTPPRFSTWQPNVDSVSQPPDAAPLGAHTGLPLTVMMTSALGVTAFMQFAPAVLSPFLLDEFGWDRWQIGALITGFTLTGAAGSPAMGRYADRIGGRNSLVVLYASSTVGLLLLAAAPGFVPMLVVMLLAGFAAAAANPATNKLIGAYVAPSRRGIVMGVKQSGGPFGIGIAGLLPLLAGALGWRWAVLVAAALPAAALIAVTAWIPPDQKRPLRRIAATAVARIPLIGWLALQGFLVGFGTGAFIAFLPLYAKETLGFSASTAGAVATLFGVLSVVGRVMWGRIFHRFADVGVPFGIVMAASVVVPLLLWMAASVSSALLWAGAAVGGLSFMTWNVFAMLAVLEGVPHRATGRASGDVLLGYLAGITPAPILFGLVVDATGTYAWGWLAVGVIFFGAALVTSRVRKALTA